MKTIIDPLLVLPAYDFKGTMQAIEATIYKHSEQTDTAFYHYDPIKSLPHYCNWLWKWLRDNVKYRPDSPLKEEIRTPNRTLADKDTGVDCEDFAIFISTVLLNNNILHCLRVADYSSGWAHIYVVANPDTEHEVIIDPVNSQFNVEKPFVVKKDYKIKLSGKGLSGIEVDGVHYPKEWRGERSIEYLKVSPKISFTDFVKQASTDRDKYFLKVAKASLKAKVPYVAYNDAYSTYRSYPFEKVMWTNSVYLISADAEYVYVSYVHSHPIIKAEKDKSVKVDDYVRFFDDEMYGIVTMIDSGYYTITDYKNRRYKLSENELTKINEVEYRYVKENSDKEVLYKTGDYVETVSGSPALVRRVARNTKALPISFLTMADGSLKEFDQNKIGGKISKAVFETGKATFEAKEASKSTPKQSGKLKMNQEIERLLDSQKTFNQVQLRYLKNYSGSGGKAKDGATGEGLLYEFYTPDQIAALMWEIAVAHGYDGGNVLEPSCGTGVFFDTAPVKEAKFVGFEINPYSAKIAQLRHPKATIYNLYFEMAFLDPIARYRSKFKGGLTWLAEYPFDIVIGNPPYGTYQNQYSPYFLELKKKGIRQIEMAFMYWSLQMLKPKGLMVYITSQNFMRTGIAYQSSKELLGEMAELVDAYRLPSVFDSSQVPTDILIFRKK